MAQKKPTDGPAKRKQQLLSVSETRYDALEKAARARRKKTGDAITWQDIANEAIDKHVG